MTPGLVCLCQYHTTEGKAEEERGGGGEREKRNGRLGQQDVSAMRVRQIHAPDCNSSAVLLTPVTRLGGRGTEANSKQRLWCKCFGQAKRFRRVRVTTGPMGYREGQDTKKNLPHKQSQQGPEGYGVSTSKPGERKRHEWKMQ